MQLRVLIATLLLLGIPAAASAHIHENDGSMEAVLHMDSAAADVPTTIYIEFNELDYAFALSDCDCSIAITDATTTDIIQIRPAYAVDETHAAIPYTFAHDTPVTILVRGASRSGKFISFTIPFTTTIGADMHDDDDQQMSDSMQNGMRDHDIIVGTIFALGCITYGGIVARGEYLRRKKR
jgi:hypothetical protein